MGKAGKYLVEAGRDCKSLAYINAIFALVYTFVYFESGSSDFFASAVANASIVALSIILGLVDIYLIYGIGKNLVDAGNELIEN